MFAFGSIVLTRFPFTDLSGDKRRPALVVSRDNQRRADLVVCFITSVLRTGPDMAPIAPSPGTGLKVPFVVRFDKLATLDCGFQCKPPTYSDLMPPGVPT